MLSCERALNAGSTDIEALRDLARAKPLGADRSRTSSGRTETRRRLGDRFGSSLRSHQKRQEARRDAPIGIGAQMTSFVSGRALGRSGSDFDPHMRGRYGLDVDGRSIIVVITKQKAPVCDYDWVDGRS